MALEETLGAIADLKQAGYVRHIGLHGISRATGQWIEALAKIAKARGATIAQLAFAWLRSRGGDIVPLIGARRCDQLTEALAGLKITLTQDELRRSSRRRRSALPPASAMARWR